jgi:hypothetical protein
MVRQRFFTAIQRLTVLQRAGFHCQLCGIELQPNNFHCDHKKLGVWAVLQKFIMLRRFVLTVI